MHKLQVNLPHQVLLPYIDRSLQRHRQQLFQILLSTTTIVPVSNANEKVNNYAVTHSNGGFFSMDYAGSGKSASGSAGTFKSTSGWTDGKYYALMNGIPVGTIIRVSGLNGKTIYAKVLGQLPEMKESNGLAHSDQQCCIC